MPKAPHGYKPPPIEPQRAPIPIAFTHHTFRGDPDPAYKSLGGPIRFTLPDNSVIEIEAYVRPGNPIGLLIRGIDCMLDVEPQASNTIIVKPRVEID